MCGRFNYVISEGMVSLFDEFGVEVSGATRYNLAPTEQVPIIRQTNGKPQSLEARWWLVPSWSDGPSSQFAMFNARAETLASSRAFQEPFKHKRCLIPASSYIEWKSENGRKQAYEVFSDVPLLFAGMWDEWNGEITSCAMITTQASEVLAPIHQRMPVMLNSVKAKQWINMEISSNDLKSWLQADLDMPMYYHMIDNSIGNVHNKAKPTKMISNINMTLF
ncbi:SOS response-associated peptidase [Oceaniserpentilla sp. 4NH20-0058]